ncbi:MAG: HutD family protein [Caldimonas sp.]
MKTEQVRLAAAPAQPWRNGGGVTRELLAWPDPADWQVRVSVADIETDGPFSSFPGVQRWFAVLEGGVTLNIDGREQVCRAGDAPLAFAGDTAVACRRLNGASRDLNLMLRDTPGAMQPVVDGDAWAPKARHCGLYAVQAGRCRAGAADLDVPAATLLWFAEAPERLTFRAGPPEPGTVPGNVSGWWLAAGAAPGGDA